MIDPEEDAKETPASGDTLTALNSLADRLDALKESRDSLEEKKKRVSADINHIECSQMPDLMESAGVSSFTTTRGDVYTVDDVLKGSVPTVAGINKARGEQKESLTNRRRAALRFLLSNNGGSLIKCNIVCEVPKGDGEGAEAILTDLREKGYRAEAVESVHPGSLNKWIKERKENGLDVDEEAFSVYNGKKIEVKRRR